MADRNQSSVPAPNTEPARELVEEIEDDARQLWGNGDIRFNHDSDEALARLLKNVEALAALAAREETT